MAKSLGISPTKIQLIFVCLICKTLSLGWYCLSSLIILIGVLNFGSIPVAVSRVLFLQFEGGMKDWVARGREGDPEAFLFLLAGVFLLAVMSMVVIIIRDNYKLKIIR